MYHIASYTDFCLSGRAENGWEKVSARAGMAEKAENHQISNTLKMIELDDIYNQRQLSFSSTHLLGCQPGILVAKGGGTTRETPSAMKRRVKLVSTSHVWQRTFYII